MLSHTEITEIWNKVQIDTSKAVILLELKPCSLLCVIITQISPSRYNSVN
jgi:hypothetical protein